MSWKYKIHLKLTIKHSRRICKRMKFENLLFPPPSFSKNMQKTIFYSNYFLAPPCLPPPSSLSHCISIVPHPLFPFFLFSTFTPLIPFTVATTLWHRQPQQTIATLARVTIGYSWEMYVLKILDQWKCDFIMSKQTTKMLFRNTRWNHISVSYFDYTHLT